MALARARITGALLAGALVALPAVLPATAANAAPAQPLAPLMSVAKPIAGSYIVVYKDSAKAAESGKLESRIRTRGAQVSQRYTSGLRGFAGTLSASALADVRRDPNVKYVQPDSVVSVSAVDSWGIDRINQRNLPLNQDYRANTNGTGVHAYIVDSGIRTSHAQFGGRATLDKTFIEADGKQDCLGHGSHVAGTVGGATVGVARGVRLHGVRVFGCARTTSSSIIISGINWVTANAQRPAVMNLSLGGGANAATDDAVQKAINAGITSVVSAGNDNVDACTQSPARLAAAITVGNSTSADARWTTSNFGTCLDLFAPGRSISSASNASDTGLVSMTGTSMAAPHVAGVAALFLNSHRTATPAQVRAKIVGTSTPNLITGAGAGSPNRLLYSTIDSTGDFNGDGTSDVTVWRPSNGNWYVRGISTTQYGQSGDVITPGDYNGDGTTDKAVFRPSNGTWYVRGISTTQYGQSGDIPVPADYDGNGTTDIAVFRPSNGTWYVRGMWNVQWGQSGDRPVHADYNGDGRAEVAVFRPSNGTWYVRLLWNVQWGQAGDVPMTGDFNGDGIAEVSVWRPSNGTWYVRNFWNVQWGQAGDRPVTGDFNGDGMKDIAVFRPSDGMWHARLFWSLQWGMSGDVPV